MGWLKNNWIIVVIGLIVIAAGFYFMKAKGSTVVDPSAGKLGLTSSGKDYFESDVVKEMNIIKGDPNWFQKIKDIATKDGKPLNDVLRGNALWMIENAPGH